MDWCFPCFHCWPSCACSVLRTWKKGGLCLQGGVSRRSNGGMLLWRENEVRGKRIHPLGGIMRGSSCLPLGQTAHRCEGASGPDRAKGECWSPCAMTSFSDPGLPLTPAPLPAIPAPQLAQDRDYSCLHLTPAVK